MIHKRFTILAAFALIISGTQAQNNIISGGHLTANTMNKGKWECGVFQPLRIGISERMEFNSSAFLFPLLPNAGLKVSWKAIENTSFATEHSLSIPSVFLNTFSRKGIGGLLSPEFDFPFMASTQHSLLISRVMSDSAIVNLRAGFAWTYRTGDVDPLATIDLPLFYPRMANYYDAVSLRAGISSLYPIAKRWMLEEGFQVFILTRNQHNFFFENSGSVSWRIKRSFRLKAGYNLSYGSYPFGNHWQLWPSIDILFGSRK